MLIYGEFQQSIGELLEQLKALNIPFIGIIPSPAEVGEAPDFRSGGIPYVVRITHDENTTNKQRKDLEKVIKTFNFEKRKPRQKSLLRAELAALSDADFRELLIELMVVQIENDPKFARKLGKTIDGDEVTASLR